MKSKSGTKRRTRSVVGKMINFRGLVYAPVNEQGVVFLFGKVAHDFGMYVELIRPGYPDCVAKRYIGKDRWENVNIEFEFKSSHFKHDPKECDMIVCWEHDWKDCPSHIEVIELREEIKNMDNPPIEAPDRSSNMGDYVLEDHLRRGNEDTKKLYEDLEGKLLALDDKVYKKVAKYWIMFYSPRRVFASVRVLKQQLRLHLFTNGKRFKGVESFTGDYGMKWGRMYLKRKNEIPQVVRNLRNSLVSVNDCVRQNIPTGWHAEVEEERQ